MANDGVSMREFARQVGRSAAYVSGKCKTGELPLVDGKIPLEEGLKAFKALVKSEERKKASRRTSRKTADVFTGDDEDDKQISSALNVNEAFNKARLAKEVAPMLRRTRRRRQQCSATSRSLPRLATRRCLKTERSAKLRKSLRTFSATF